MGNVIINNDELRDDEYSQKCEEYAKYIDEHVMNIKAAFNDLFRNPNKPFTNFHGITGEKLDNILNKLEMAVACHDSSKYTDEEFEAYRAKYYPTTKEKERMEHDAFYAQLVNAEYDVAWKHHFITNDHHPNHWKWITFENIKRPVYTDSGKEAAGAVETVKTKVILKTPREVALPMKPIAILHMICDWQAMSTKFNNRTTDWYMSERSKDERAALNPSTKVIVEELLEQLYGVKITF